MTGFINVDKPLGKSSGYVVNIIKRLIKEKVGHLGTLDPVATGVLPIAIGNATRLFDYFLEKRKRYIATFKFGVNSDTLDITGNITKTNGYIPNRADVESVLDEFKGDFMQIPPAYSAKNVGGTRGYILARQGIEFELSPKKITVFDIVLKTCESDEFTFEIDCSAGTYIRSLARDIAKRLSTCAVMSALQRTKSGIFEIENSIKLEQLNEENIKTHIIPVQDVLPYKIFSTTEREQKKLLCGLTSECGLSDGIYKFFLTDGSLYGLAEVNKNKVKVRTKLC